MHLPPFKAVNQKEYLMNQNAHYINVYFKPDAFYTYGCYSGSQWESIFPTMHQNTEQTCNHKIERSDWNIHDTTNSHYPFINHTKKKEKKSQYMVNTHSDSPTRYCQFNSWCWCASRPSHVQQLCNSTLGASAAYLSFLSSWRCFVTHLFRMWYDKMLSIKREYLNY